jgi:hypothetical protein
MIIPFSLIAAPMGILRQISLLPGRKKNAPIVEQTRSIFLSRDPGLNLWEAYLRSREHCSVGSTEKRVKPVGNDVTRPVYI